MRASALLIAADASYATHSYRDAATRYGEFVTTYAQSPDAPRAAMARGWAELRAGRRDQARQAWMQLATRYAVDARAPLALALAAEIRRGTSDGMAERQLVDQHAASPYAGIARLNRSAAELRAQREDAAVREIDAAIRDHGAFVINERRRLAQAIATPSAPPVERPVAPTAAPGDARDPVERAAPLIDRRDADGPLLLHGLALLAASNHGWSDGLTLTVTTRLADVFPSYPATPSLFARIGSSAAANEEWRVARQAYEALATRYPDSVVARNGSVDFGEALYRTGANGDARRVLEKAAAGVGTDGARALLLLGDLHATAGDNLGALAAYDRAMREHPRHPRSTRSLLTHARLLQQNGQGAKARQVLQKAVAVGEGEDAAEAAYRLGQALRAEGYTTAAVEWYMTAAYVAEGSQWAHHALRDAAGILKATGDHAAAEILNRRLARPRVSEDGVTPSANGAASRATPWVPVIEEPSASPPTDGASVRGYARPR